MIVITSLSNIINYDEELKHILIIYNYFTGSPSPIVSTKHPKRGEECFVDEIGQVIFLISRKSSCTQFDRLLRRKCTSTKKINAKATIGFICRLYSFMRIKNAYSTFQVSHGQLYC